MHHVVLQMAKLQAHEPTTGFQHTIRLLQDLVHMCAISYSKGNCVGGELIVVERQLFGIRTNPIYVTEFVEIQAQAERIRVTYGHQ